MKKRVIAIILTLLYVLGLTACACEHSWKKADCESPKTCRECGETKGNPKHKWKDATCEEPKTCEECGKTKGKPLEHEWLPADCTTPEECYLCGQIRGEALGHVWDGRICENCYAENPAEEVTLTVWAPAEDQSEESPWLQTMCDNFAQMHPEYDITWEFVAVSAADAKNMILGDPWNGPDVYMFANEQLGELVQANALAPITGNVLEQVEAGTSATMLSSVTFDDAVYGIPYAGNTWWLYYDKSVFSESDIKSLETMLEKGKVAFRLNNGWYFGSFYFANGCSMFGPNGNEPSRGFDFSGEKAVAVTNYLVDLVKNPNFVCDDGGNGLVGIRDGTIKAFVSGDWEAEPVKEALGENFGAAQLPCITIDGQQKQLRAFAGSKAIGVNPNSDNLIASYLFAMYLGSAEGQKLRYEMCGVIPCNTSLADVIAHDPVALAQMNCLNNSAAVQPTIPEMGIWWNNAANLANEIISGAVTHKNAEEKTKTFNEILNEG